MENKGLLFIPDISGFSRFVSETEINHSRLIIQELLEILINANQIGLDVSEIEGDAILFYKFGEPPEIEELYSQVVKMFCEFHRLLLSYEHRRYCQCHACTSAIDLSLKIISHYGEFTGYNVKNFNKLIGKDVIVAHQLLKNEIEQHEYWLVTKNLLKDAPPGNIAEWMEWNSSIKQTESGEMPFHYTQLSLLKKEIKPLTSHQWEIPNRTKVFSVSKEYETDIITLFHAAGDFNFRAQWQEGIKRIEEIDHFLPRVGMKCRCIMENGGDVVIYSSSYFYSSDRIEFSETDEDKKSSAYFTLEKTDSNKVKLTIDFYLKDNIILLTLFNMMKKKKKYELYRKSLENLEKLVKELDYRFKIPG